MGKNKNTEDTISETEYTMNMTEASTDPQDDSPGDSESDAGSEFEMGLKYIPNEKNEPENPVDAPIEEPTNPEDPQVPILVMKEIPDSAQVVSSEQPAPWMDMESDSSTH